MNTSLAADLERLRKLAYHRAEWSGDLVRQMHRLPRKRQKHPDYAQLLRLHRWLFVPLTLWPIDLDGLCRHVLRIVRSGRRLDEKEHMLIALLGDPPPEPTQAVVSQHEQHVQRGEYESLLHARHKYDFKEQELLSSPNFAADWKRIKALFAIRKHQNPKGIIRRTMVQERNFRHDFTFSWDDEESRFHEVFNAFCHRWNLYGMEGDTPLQLQMTVNLTPFGTMIFIPSYWSFDPKRDFKWQTITALHRARGVPRQGPKLGMGQLSRAEESRKARALWEQARRAGLKGDRKVHWIMGKMGWDPRTDESKLKRLLKMSERGSTLDN